MTANMSGEPFSAAVTLRISSARLNTPPSARAAITSASALASRSSPPLPSVPPTPRPDAATYPMNFPGRYGTFAYPFLSFRGLPSRSSLASARIRNLAPSSAVTSCLPPLYSRPRSKPAARNAPVSFAMLELAWNFTGPPSTATKPRPSAVGFSLSPDEYTSVRSFSLSSAIPVSASPTRHSPNCLDGSLVLGPTTVLGSTTGVPSLYRNSSSTTLALVIVTTFQSHSPPPLTWVSGSNGLYTSSPFFASVTRLLPRGHSRHAPP